MVRKMRLRYLLAGILLLISAFFGGCGIAERILCRTGSLLQGKETGSTGAEDLSFTEDGFDGGSSTSEAGSSIGDSSMVKDGNSITDSNIAENGGSIADSSAAENVRPLPDEHPASARDVIYGLPGGETCSENKESDNTEEAEDQEDTIRYIFMGDSRTVGLYCSQAYSKEEYESHIFYHISSEYTGNVGNRYFIAKGGEGYSWFSTYGLALAALQIDEKAVLICWYGVNDLTFVERYIGYMNGAALAYGIPVYYLTVGPVNGSWEESSDQILAFNEKLKSGLDPAIHVIDVWSFLKEGMEDGRFHTLDGLHYDYETSSAVCDFVAEEIREDQSAAEK